MSQTITLAVNQIYQGDCRELLPRIEKDSVACSFWSPPYFVGKQYEAYLTTFEDWKSLIRDTIRLHFPIVSPGGFLVVNIADILCFEDPSMPKIQAENVDRRRSKVTKEDVLRAQERFPGRNRYQLAELLGCSEQTVDRRLKGNNIRGGKYANQTRVKVVGGLIEQWGTEAGFYLYDRRIWVKDPAWENSKWTTLSYRAVDEFEYLYFFWKPGITTVSRDKLTPGEWSDWGSRAVWSIPSVRANDDHEAKFPRELPRRVIALLTEPDDIVLDPFIGSGTTAEAAIMEGRRYIGIEKSPNYAKLALRRVREVIGRPRQMELPDQSMSSEPASAASLSDAQNSNGSGTLLQDSAHQEHARKQGRRHCT
ncbi:MAG: site-specific DNA-methyltransferase [Bryobacteraceae bacterium]|jgi:site-specific DNA-methyltransferase (adenine-specific)